jgi:RNase P subunit RPR2
METQKQILEVREQINTLDKATLCPLHFNFSGNMKEATGYKAVYNIHSDKFCCSVSDEYKVIQHSDFFNSVLDSLDKLNIPYEAKAIQHKNKGYLYIDLIGDVLTLQKGEEFQKGIRLTNSYNKTTGVRIEAHFKRLVCDNGMTISRFSGIINSKHNSIAINDMDKIILNGLNVVFSQNDKLLNWISESMTDSIDWKATLKIISALFKDRKHKIAILKQLGINTEITGKKGQQKENYTADELSKKTRWEIYNAVTFYCSHTPKLRISQEDTFQRIGERILTTTLSELPQIEVTI